MERPDCRHHGPPCGQGTTIQAWHYQPSTGSSGPSITVVPQSEEMMEKLFGLLQVEHRPFVLYEVTQIQLSSYAPVLQPPPILSPASQTLIGPGPISQPHGPTNMPGRRVIITPVPPQHPRPIQIIPRSDFLPNAIGNIDTDATQDNWSISTDSRELTMPPAGQSEAGEPTNDENDVNR